VLVSPGTLDPAAGILRTELDHFSTFQVRQTDPGAVTAEMARRFREALDVALQAPPLPVHPCTVVSGFAVSVNGSNANDQNVAACLSINGTKLGLSVVNRMSSGVSLTGGEFSRSAGPVGVFDRAGELVAKLNLPGSTYLPGGATATVDLPPDGRFPFIARADLESSPLVFNVVFGAVTKVYGYRKLENAEAAFDCVDQLAQKGLHEQGEALQACVRVPESKRFPLWWNATAEGINQVLDETPQRFGELVQAVGGTGSWQIAVRRTDEPLPSEFASVFDRNVLYEAGGYRYRIIIHFGQIQFVTRNSCDGQQAGEGVRFIEVPYTLQSMSSDRYIPPAVPPLILVDTSKKGSGLGAKYETTTLDPQAVSWGSEPSTCKILSGAYSREQQGMVPNGAMHGVYVEKGFTRGSIREDGDFSPYYLVLSTVLGFIKPDPGQALAWTLAGQPVTDIP
jgi:hypothetical protein